uniref:Reverse transcriptase/retrotransposon-derived protein RNase H-like domain-containing protein n=1 Tax=Haplochromis burtoni TaxID=8153 RepID=A0A3Q2VFT3_HAPBU
CYLLLQCFFTHPILKAPKQAETHLYKIQWTPEAEGAFTKLKIMLQTNVVLTLPDYDKPSYLNLTQGHMKAVLTQSFGEKQRPLAFYSRKLDSVASGMPTCRDGYRCSVFTLKAILALPGTELGAQLFVSHLNLHRGSGAKDRAATLH